MLAARTEAINRERLSNKSAANESDGSIVSRLVAYTSEEGHSSIEKAGLMSLVKVRHLATDENYSLRGATLKEAIIKDREQGLLPFYVCASLGTTSCSSFDRLDELGPVCEEENIWLHVDAAYAGSAFICPEFRHFLSGVECAQSFVFNPSKWLLVNFDCTALWFTVTSPRTTKEDLEADWKLIQEETAKLLSVGSPEITTHGLNENITPTSDISLADALTSKLEEKLEEKPDSGLRTAAGIKPGRMPLGLLPHRMLKEIEKLNGVEKYYLIPNSARVEEKQEINGHYGVEG
ncbi:DDC [Bugula neritina]|uniref:Aromatic-L-amino-acid decarboxylase n=1 Tax=Bugula neritina TaxID=10212 RepID=A0A7J7JP17_BUGNE|nr:DDC [Bugula neritina]